jgi:hypothetical protein
MKFLQKLQTLSLRQAVNRLEDGIITFSGPALAISGIIARVNSMSGLSIDLATAQLGINPIALIWERSALVLVLIFLSGWFREDESETPETATTVALLGEDGGLSPSRKCNGAERTSQTSAGMKRTRKPPG